MNDTNHQQEPHPHHTLAYASRNNALTAAHQSAANAAEDEEEQIVTSTSSETYASAARLPQLDALITSPARITSSTGNDYSSSPQRVLSTRNDITTDASSEDDSQSPQQSFAGAGLELNAAYSRDVAQEFVDGAMPTTSAAAAIAIASGAAGAPATLSHCAKTTAAAATVNATAATTTATTSNASINNIRNHKLEYSSNAVDMVARETAASGALAAAADAASGSSSGSGADAAASSGNQCAAEQATHARDSPCNVSENHKIILKLPKPTSLSSSSSSSSGNLLNESHTHAAADANASSSSSGGSVNNCAAEDTRKVEPLKINLHAHHSSSVVPKITIKPIVKKSTDAASASDCSSSADDDMVGVASTGSSRLGSSIPKLTIKSGVAAMESSAGGSVCINSEPHIVPKLTIRSANEDDGTAHSSIVPKLTIKMSDAPTGTLNSSAHLQASLSLGAAATSVHAPPPPLPKLTIKTSLDGTSESIISTISPALSSSSSSSSSSASASALSTSATSVNFKVTATATCMTAATVPKLTIKKSVDETVPKLTIKTNALGACISTTAAEENECADECMGGSSSSKIPKLTIKTGQEHAVIITQHNDTSNTQTIPKLTIKTKSLEVEESLSDLSEEPLPQPPPEKIPKITIKTNDAPAEAVAPKFCIKQQHHETDACAIPKLTISVTNLGEGGAALQSPKQSPLVVRQLTCSTRKPESPERLPKLMISRQESSTHTASNNSEITEKLVPKLTIKTNSLESGESKEKSAKFAIKHNSSLEEDKRKKSTYELSTLAHAEEQSSEESDECQSGESSPSSALAAVTEATNKVVPKITIKNLSSPRKLKMKTVPAEKLRCAGAETASKKYAKPSETISGCDPNATQDGNAGKTTNLATVSEKISTVSAQTNSAAVGEPLMANGGESSNSQEFCGFNDNTTESHGDVALGSNHAEPRRISDDMDIDEGLQQHDPQVFNNVTHFGASNGENYVLHLDNECNLLQPPRAPQMDNVVDTVDLTSSPSPESSPAHFNYTDADPQIMPDDVSHYHQQQSPSPVSLSQPSPASTILMERLQREMSVIQTAPPAVENTNFLLAQLTAPLNSSKFVAGPPPLHPKPQQPLSMQSSNSAKYPQLTERLMANGARVTALASATNVAITAAVEGSAPAPATSNDVPPRAEHVIDSIEILDTPEGSPRSMLEENHQHLNNDVNDLNVYMQQVGEMEEVSVDSSAEVLRRNNNIMETHQRAETTNHRNLKRHANAVSTLLLDKDLTEESAESTPNKVRRLDSESHTMATLTILTNDHSPNATVITTSPTIIASNHCAEIREAVAVEEDMPAEPPSPKQVQQPQPEAQPQAPPSTHRSRKQRHEHLLTIPIEEEDPLQLISNDGLANAINCYETSAAAEAPATASKRRGRPKKTGGGNVTAAAGTNELPQQTPPSGDDCESATVQTPQLLDKSSKSRRVQLLRKRLAIDMVDAEQPSALLDAPANVDCNAEPETPRRDRTLRNVRNSRRSLAAANTPLEEKGKGNSDAGTTKNRKRMSMTSSITTTTVTTTNSCNADGMMSALNHYGGSNSSLSSACSSSSLSSTTVTTTATAVSVTASASLAMATQIDLTMSSSSSSVSNGSTTATVTTATVTTASAGMSMSAAHNRNSNSMLPPTTILSSSDPVPDVVFKPNDFSSLMATQQLRAQNSTCSMDMDTHLLLMPGGGAVNRHIDSQDEESMGMEGSGADYSGDDSTASSTSLPTTPGGRGRGRGRGVRGGGRGSAGSGRGTRAHRLGRGASAVAKAIALSRPRCVGGLKHMPDPDRLKGLFSPLPQVFEEDTRMSADLNSSQSEPPTPTPIRQPDFLNNEESQSSVVSNNSILDPNTVAAVQNGSAVKRPKKKKMEVCVAEDTEITVGAIAEYEWPPPKGCCPSKNRDTFMIQEQVALYLGIKSFKRKYPDLPRRQIDMEERNWLQEKGLVSEKMCDLGITAVWASDILDIMYTDFYHKYEEYKDFIRQKHLREIEVKQKALGLNFSGRGLQARDRAMLSASKWNSYFNRSRKEERVSCLDLQTLTVNVPLPATAPSTTLVNRPIAEAVAAAAKAECISEPPTLLRPRVTEPTQLVERSYPLALVPGQYCAQYRQYTPLELRCYPLNTVLDDPRTLYERLREYAIAESKSTAAVEAAASVASTTAAEPNSLDVQSTLSVGDSPAFSIAAGVAAAAKRMPVRRSRRARTAAASGRGPITTTIPTQCDRTKLEELAVGGSTVKRESKKPSIAGSCCSSSEASSTDDDSASNSDSDSDSSSSSACSSSSEEDEDTPATCGVCLRIQNRNLKDLPEVFIRCYTCRRKVHPSCIEMPHRMVARVRNYNWQCTDCKCCIKCKRRQDQNKMLFCEQCDRGFHIYCLGIKAVPDGRWSCERCSVCMRCGATKPEGQPQLPLTPNGEKIKQIKHKKVKWINEYRIDHITKLREHCSMLCVPCGRAKTTKRVQIANSSSSSCSGANATNIPSPPIAATQQSQPQQLQQQQHQQVKVQQQLTAVPACSTQMSPPAAPLSATASHAHAHAAAAVSSMVAAASSSAATGSLPPPPVVA